MRRESVQWIVPVVLAIGVAGALWFYWYENRKPDEPRREPTTQEPAPAATDEPEQPVHPLPEAAPAATETRDLRPLPPLNESDEYFEMALTDLFGNALEEQLVDTRLIERLVATVDNLPREKLAERVKPIDTVPGQFTVERQNDSTAADGRFTIDPANYERYDALVAMLADTDPQQMVDLYQRFYPLLQKAYADLGYPDAYFNDRVVEVIDHLLATPEVEGPVELVRPHVLYEYANPELEQLSSGQKALIRIGGENAAIVKQKLREFRDQITQNQQ